MVEYIVKQVFTFSITILFMIQIYIIETNHCTVSLQFSRKVQHTAAEIFEKYLNVRFLFCKEGVATNYLSPYCSMEEWVRMVSEECSLLLFVNWHP